MTEDIDIFKCLDFIRDNAEDYAIAKAHRQYLENFRKTVKAQQMKLHLSLPVSAQEREAYASEELQEIDKGIQAAMEEEIRLQWLLTAAQIKCEAWRSIQANSRMEAKVL
jgi:hypothetical protein